MDQLTLIAYLPGSLNAIVRDPNGTPCFLYPDGDLEPVKEGHVQSALTRGYMKLEPAVKLTVPEIHEYLQTLEQ